ncbi:MAG: winged helix-turn-helix domain-containing protein, partial [Psychrosphaera sp.]|nr:winged helix-turn-helix domain-containing protein [Psychrosphaera sp.]
MLTQARTKQWQLGEWVLDAPSHRLIHQGNRVSITAKMQDVLLVLLVKSPRPVTKEVIYQTVWPDVVVSEQLIARAISDLRKVFGDSAKKPKFIETLPKVGYRWLASVSEIVETPLVKEVSVAAVSQQSELAPERAPKPEVIKKRSIVLPVIALMMVVFMLVWLGFDGVDDASPSFDDTAFEISLAKPLTSEPGVENAPTLSPDGKTLAYVYRKSENDYNQIILSDLTTRQVIAKVPFNGQSVNQFAPRFSPDGKHLAFTRYSSDRISCAVYYVRLDKLEAQHKVAACSTRFMMSVDWSPDGKQLFFTQDISADKRALVRADLASATVEQLSFPDLPGTTDYSPRVSPDGKHLIFVRGQLKPSHHSAIYLLSLEPSSNPALNKPKALTSLQVQLNIYGLSWINNQQVVYLLDADIKQLLRKLSIVDGTDMLLESGSYHRIDYHRPSGTLVYAQSKQVSNIVKLSLADENTEPPTAVLASTRKDHQPRVSPDGSQIAFVADRSGSDQLWMADTKGENLRQLTRLPRAVITDISWSPDGLDILLTVQSKNTTGLYRLLLQDSVLKRITTGDFEVVDARFSSHRQWLVASCDINGSWQICRIPSNGGTPKVVTDEGGVSPYTPHHSDFVYFTRQQQGLWRTPLLGGSQELVWQAFPEHSWKNWILYENQLYYLNHDGLSQQAKLMRRDLISNETQVIYQGSIQWDET